ncbi:Histone-lysine N-methyltransferase setd3 [Gossypium arboreum]|uniref:Histone-lysine N-methyltransferase setd3 n=1 Tax=Gossypium arboreum TaxID=29729 RepID=A0A0B0MR23_GOSAR|nr:Histone-lysine N-methyltransferase setd3 [Gossypium arboreum]
MAAAKLLIPTLSHFRPLTCAAAVSATNPARLVPHPPDLLKWIKREGGFVHEAVTITQDTTYGLGLVASGGIPKGSDLIVLPEHVPLKFQSDKDDEADSVLLPLSNRVPEELWAMKLGLKLLQERAKVGSFWWPYISNLPETYTVPIFFSGEDIKNLQYAPLLYQVNKRCRFLLEFEQEVKNVLKNLKPSEHPFGGQDVDASSLGWAMSAVSSRAFRLYGKKLPNGTHSDIPMMLPLIDMCNHSFNPNARILQEQDAGNPKMLIKAGSSEREIKQSDPLLLNYGCLSNDFFLLDYGFVIPSNPYDHIELKYDGALMDAASMAAGVSSPNFSSPAPWQQEILFQLNLDGEVPNLKVTIGGPELVEGRLLAALRVLLSNDREMVQRYDLSVLKSLSAEGPLGVANEVAAFRTIIALCVIALGHFPTKIMDDESLLKQGVSVSTELAIQFRMQKKSVIIDVMRDLTKRVKVLLSKETTTA